MPLGKIAYGRYETIIQSNLGAWGADGKTALQSHTARL